MPVDQNLKKHPPRVPDFRIVEVSDGRFLAGEIFARKLGGTLPDYGRHLVALYRNDPFRFTPLGYLNILPHATVALVGGGSVDGRAFADIPAEAGQRIADAGGVLYCLLTHAFNEMADDFEAFFGYCGDARAEEVDLQAGFRYTRHPRLLANFHRPLDERRRDRLTDDVFALGPF
ncbi:MAG: hypothetical protein R6V61_08690 [Wenzhouxiangellaceae bacterium]